MKTLSGGQQRRLDLGLGIVGNPELLFLDEPTTGFDPSARRGAWDLIARPDRRGTTVILTTHYMDEAEALADRVAVITPGGSSPMGRPSRSADATSGEATIRFRLPAATAVPTCRCPPRADTGAVEIRTGDEIEVLATAH